MNDREFKDLKRRVDRLQRDADKAAGAKENLMAELEKEFGCGSLEEAEALLASETKDLKVAERRFDKKLAKFKEAWDVAD